MKPALAPLEYRLGIVLGRSLPFGSFGLEAEGHIEAAYDDAIAAKKTVAEALEAASRVLEEFERRVEEWRLEQARQAGERAQQAAAAYAESDLARGMAKAHSNPKNPHEIVADVEKLGFRLRVVADNQLQIAPPPSGLPNLVKAYLRVYREQVIAELRRRDQWVAVE
jgi:hypothetical protein